MPTEVDNTGRTR